jgi:hypothetical protein
MPLSRLSAGVLASHILNKTHHVHAALFYPLHFLYLIPLFRLLPDAPEPACSVSVSLQGNSGAVNP